VKKTSRETALREIARCFLSGAGMTFPGELARVVGISRPEAGRGNRALVAEGFATMPDSGFYRLSTPLVTTYSSGASDGSDAEDSWAVS
jgi:hypothetical protein